MTSINSVRLVGKLVKAPEFLETSGKKRFAKLLIETWKHKSINGEARRVAHSHTVLCFNQFSLTFLEKQARVGTRVHVHGELTYDRNGKAEVVVLQYSGELGPMDEEENMATPTNKSETSPTTAPGISKQGGGFGRLSLRSNSSSNSHDNDFTPPPTKDNDSDISEDDLIPF